MSLKGESWAQRNKYILKEEIHLPLDLPRRIFKKEIFCIFRTQHEMTSFHKERNDLPCQLYNWVTDVMIYGYLL